MKVGDQVEVIDDDIKGHVSEIQGNIIGVLTSEGFEMEFDRSELVVMAKEVGDKHLFSEGIEEKLAMELSAKDKKRKPSGRRRKEQPPMEVDLHIWKLVDKTKGMTNFEMLNIQVDTAKRQLEFAIRNRIQRIVFIHGVGEGILRAELETLFNRYDNLKHYDADFRKYGAGATEVYIFQNPKG